MLPDARYIVDRIVTDRDGAPSVRLRAGEMADFSRDWQNQLAPGETILDSEWTSDGEGILSHGRAGAVTTVWLDAADLDLAEDASFATVVNTVETSTGRRDSWTLRVYPPDA